MKYVGPLQLENGMTIQQQPVQTEANTVDRKVWESPKLEQINMSETAIGNLLGGEAQVPSLAPS